MILNWLESVTRSWRAATAAGRLPHAVLLQGVPGVGKRALAAWMLRHKLGMHEESAEPVFPVQWPEHADAHRVTVPEDKTAIGIDLIRDLVHELSLTSYEGRGKAAVLEPANAMTEAAANGLLKTLEEPQGDTLIVLVADQLRTLPATILSRCQRLRIELPDHQQSIEWLRSADRNVDWETALTLGAGGPLRALALRRQLDFAKTMAHEFAGVRAGRVSALDVAARWVRQDTDFVLDWLARRIQGLILVASGARQATPGELPESVLRHMDSRNMFCYLDIINEIRAQPAGSFDPAVTIESLLIHWSQGLERIRQPFGPGELLPDVATG